MEEDEMGAIAEAIVAYAQPLLDDTDGSVEEMNKAFSMAQFCYNLAILPEESRNEMLGTMQEQLAMDDEEFEGFRSSLVDRMIRRHEKMFPFMHRRASPFAFHDNDSRYEHPRVTSAAENQAVTDRYAPCPCNSGKKYKFCCGKKGR